MIALSFRLNKIFSKINTRNVSICFNQTSWSCKHFSTTKTIRNSNDTESGIDTDVKSILDTFHEGLHAEKRVFILQPRMQFKSKTRQSMNAELQLEESRGLIKTLNTWKIVDSCITSTKNINKKTIWGSGNLEMLSNRIASSGANCIFIGVDRLTNLQKESIKRELANDASIEIYDRYTIVLKIFKLNARTTIAKLQISLAELDYKRYKMNNNELYQELEKKIKNEIDKQAKKRLLLNQNRRKLNIPLISVLGYTNNGKTSLIKRLTDDKNLVPENRLFATLDITYHGMRLPNSNINVIFIDTIGFISDIPYNLINAFKITLADALESDLFLHLVDATHPDYKAQENVVKNILNELDIDQSKISNMITAYNKYDKLKETSEIDRLCENDKENRCTISCLTGHGIENLLDLIEQKIMNIRNYLEVVLKVPQGGDEMKYLYKNCIIKEMKAYENDENFLLMNILFDKVNAIRFMKNFPNAKVVSKK